MHDAIHSDTGLLDEDVKVAEFFDGLKEQGQAGEEPRQIIDRELL